MTAGEQLILCQTSGLHFQLESYSLDFDCTQFDPVVRMEEICLVSYLEESLAPEIKDLDVWTDWVSSPGTVALSTGQSNRVGSSCQSRSRALVDCTQEARGVSSSWDVCRGWHWQMPSGGIELSAEGR